MIGNIVVQSFTIPHDAIDPVGFCFHVEGVKVGVATDLGYMPDSIKVHLRRVQMLLLESNHDLEMLKVGPYPWSVKFANPELEQRHRMGVKVVLFLVFLTGLSELGEAQAVGRCRALSRAAR